MIHDKKQRNTQKKINRNSSVTRLLSCVCVYALFNELSRGECEFIVSSSDLNALRLETNVQLSTTKQKKNLKKLIVISIRLVSLGV